MDGSKNLSNAAAAKEELMRQELAELDAVGDDVLLPAKRPAQQSGGAMADSSTGGVTKIESPAEKIDKLFKDKATGYQIPIRDIMSAVGARNDTQPAWHEAIKHLKAHYKPAKATSGTYLFSRKV